VLSGYYSRAVSMAITAVAASKAVLAWMARRGCPRVSMAITAVAASKAARSHGPRTGGETCPWRSLPWLHQRFSPAIRTGSMRRVSMAITAVAASKEWPSGGRSRDRLRSVHGDHCRGCIKGLELRRHGRWGMGCPWRSLPWLHQRDRCMIRSWCCSTCVHGDHCRGCIKGTNDYHAN
jgi:hypothetical protein